MKYRTHGVSSLEDARDLGGIARAVRVVSGRDGTDNLVSDSSSLIRAKHTFPNPHCPKGMLADENASVYQGNPRPPRAHGVFTLFGIK